MDIVKRSFAAGCGMSLEKGAKERAKKAARGKKEKRGKNRAQARREKPGSSACPEINPTGMLKKGNELSIQKKRTSSSGKKATPQKKREEKYPARKKRSAPLTVKGGRRRALYKMAGRNYRKQGGKLGRGGSISKWKR